MYSPATNQWKELKDKNDVIKLYEANGLGASASLTDPDERKKHIKYNITIIIRELLKNVKYSTSNEAYLKLIAEYPGIEKSLGGSGLELKEIVKEFFEKERALK